MATPRKYETGDNVYHPRTGLDGRVERIRRDHLGGTRMDTAIRSGVSWPVSAGPVRDELLVKYEDGSVSWTDSQDVRLRGNSV